VRVCVSGHAIPCRLIERVSAVQWKFWYFRGVFECFPHFSPGPFELQFWIYWGEGGAARWRGKTFRSHSYMYTVSSESNFFWCPWKIRGRFARIPVWVEIGKPSKETEQNIRRGGLSKVHWTHLHSSELISGDKTELGSDPDVSHASHSFAGLSNSFITHYLNSQWQSPKLTQLHTMSWKFRWLVRRTDFSAFTASQNTPP
jgi:hypothetical protein